MRYRITTENIEALRTISLYNKIGFEIGNGWFPLLFDLGQKISSFCRDNNLPLPEVKQIKEKFGTLRFYCVVLEDKDKQIREWIRNAEFVSESRCEQCGESGQLLVDDGRWYTACDTHRSPNSLTGLEFQTEREQQCNKINNSI